jgi:iron-sulfur cluster repair protein YtfE (RIC family)
VKRHLQLRPLSRQHRDGLIEARRLRRAAEGREPLPDSVAIFLSVWEAQGRPHLLVEEEILLPAFARAAGERDPLIARTLAEHAALRRSVGALAAAAGEAQRQLAGEIGRALDDHIRFEERVLFPAVEAALTEAQLKAVGDELQGRGWRSNP